MIDGIKTITQNVCFERLKDYLELPFCSSIDMETGEQIPKFDKFGIRTYWHTAAQGSLKYLVKERIQNNKVSYSLHTSGSMHKNHFRGANFNDFTFDNVLEQISLLTKKTGLNAADFHLQNLEFGVNIKTPFSPIDYLNNNLIADKGEPLNRYEPDKLGRSIGYVHNMHQYHKKIYDKGLQYGLNENLMRFELSYKKMFALNKLGIDNVQHLTQIRNIQNLEPLLLRAWSEILFKDSFNGEPLNNGDKIFLTNATNSKYWEQSKSDNTYREKRRKFKKLQHQYCIGTQQQLKEKIKSKFHYLLAN